MYHPPTAADRREQYLHSATHTISRQHNSTSQLQTLSRPLLGHKPHHTGKLPSLSSVLEPQTLHNGESMMVNRGGTSKKEIDEINNCAQ